MTTAGRGPGLRPVGFDAYGYDDEGQALSPLDGNLAEWVAAGRTRNFAHGNPLLDWLQLFGKNKGFVRDDERPGWDPPLDFGTFILEKGQAFEAAVVAHLEGLASVARMPAGTRSITSLDGARETFAAMEGGAEIIHQAVLWNPANRTYGSADLLVRSDVLRGLFPDALTEAEAAAGAMGRPWHYRVVDIKFSTLTLLKDGHAAGGHRDYMMQVCLYNEALGRIQGFEPPAAFLLGRGWEQGKHERGTSCMERLAPVSPAFGLRNMGPLRAAVAEAVEWVRRVRREGADWHVFPAPSVPELRPNSGNASNRPWRAAVEEIALELEDLTRVWQVGPPARDDAAAHGITRWTDPQCTAANLGFKPGPRAATVDAILAINRAEDGPPVSPAVVQAEAETWRTPGPIEFYVDFETVNAVDDDFSRIPEQNGQQLIFMVGCGHMEEGEWRFACFVADRLTEEAEGRMIDAWLAHMAAVRERLGATEEPLLFHWSPAETSTFETAFNSAKARHADANWPSPHWFDFLNRVVKQEPVVVRGAMAFGLKAVAKALHSHGLIETSWGDGVADGLGAMVAAWRCDRELGETNGKLIDLPLMEEVRRYNEVDCRVMMEAVGVFRSGVPADE